MRRASVPGDNRAHCANQKTGGDEITGSMEGVVEISLAWFLRDSKGNCSPDVESDSTSIVSHKQRTKCRASAIANKKSQLQTEESWIINIHSIGVKDQ